MPLLSNFEVAWSEISELVDDYSIIWENLLIAFFDQVFGGVILQTLLAQSFGNLLTKSFGAVFHMEGRTSQHIWHISLH